MRVLIADDQVLVRDALRSLLEDRGHEVVGEASTGRDAIELARHHAPDVVLLDLDVPVAQVRATTARISSELSGTSVLVLTERENEEECHAAIASGAKGYVTKDLGAEDFCLLVELAGRGEVVFAASREPGDLPPLPERRNGGARARIAASLTLAERKVLRLMATGATSNQELADSLGVSENTVRFHMRNVLGKLNVHSRAAAVGYVITNGLVDVDPDSTP
jgi:DNA-binding NarL/FixJ family response regulator